MSDEALIAIVGIIVAGFASSIASGVSTLVRYRLERNDRRTDSRNQALLNLQQKVIELADIKVQDDIAWESLSGALMLKYARALMLARLYAAQTGDARLSAILRETPPDVILDNDHLNEIFDRIAAVLAEP